MKKIVAFAVLFFVILFANNALAGVELNQLVVDPNAKLPSGSISLEQVEEIWQKLAATTGFDAMVFYNDEDTKNAYITRAEDGTYQVVMYRGLLEILRAEDEIAGVFAHEIGHGVHNHLEKARNNMVGVMVGANILGALLGGNKLGELAIGIGANLAVNGYSREQEVEADDYGVEYSAKSGFAAMGLSEAILRMAEAGLVTPPSGFNSHPPTERRMTRLRSQAERWNTELNKKAELPPTQQQPTTQQTETISSDGPDVIASFPIDDGEKRALTMLHNNSVKLFNSGRYKDALAGFTRAAMSYDKNYLAAYWAARCAQKIGDNVKMKRWIDQSLAINPNYEPAKRFKAKYF